MNTLITGCTGYIGRHLVRRLLDEKHQVRALVRKSDDAVKLVEQGIEVHMGDITQPHTLVGIAEDIDVVFHLASIFLGPDYRKVVVEGTKNMINAFRNSQIRSFVFSSFSLVYGPSRDIFLKEDAPCRPNFPEAKYKLQAEELLLEAHRHYRFPAVILRMPSVYGGIQSHFETIFLNRIKNGQMVIFGHGNNKNSYVHIDDVIQALMLAATNENAIGEVFNIAGGDAVTMNELCSFIAKATRGKTPRHIPIWTAYVISLVTTTVAYLQGQAPPLPTSLIRILTISGALDISKARRILGYEPMYPSTLEGIKSSYFSERHD